MHYNSITCRLLLCSLFGGCYPITQQQGPRSLGKGTIAISLAPNWDSEPTSVPGAPNLGIGVHGGASEKVDLSAQFLPLSLQLGVKGQLADGDVDVALATHAVFAIDVDRTIDESTGPQGARVAAIRPALYVGVGSADVSVWLAPGFHVGVRAHESTTEVFAGPSALLGVSIRVSDKLTIQPELGFLAPMAGRSRGFEPNATELLLGPGDYRVQGSFALISEL
jgi:hypothetical protein